MDRKYITIGLLLVLTVALVGIPEVSARSGYLSSFNTLYGTSNTNLDSCDTCHITKADRNPYGADMDAEMLAGATDEQALINIEPLDSDGDGYTNIDEINALTLPGDAADYPVANQPPVADAGGPYSEILGNAISFDGSGSSDADGTIASYSWDFGDGNTGTGVNPAYTYATDGVFTVTLTVTDNDGATDAATTTATVTVPPPNQPPVADAGGPYSETLGNAISFDGSGSSDADGTIASYDWDFGDGNTGTGVNPAHTYAAIGTYTVTLTVTDDGGLTDTTTTTATITEVPPPTSGTVTFVITDATDGSPIEGAKVKVDGLPKKGISTDANGIAIFADLAFGDHTYSVSKRQFITDEGTISVLGDMTVNIALAPESGGGGTPEESSRKDCRDGIDNDGDGLIDAQDPGCSKWYK